MRRIVGLASMAALLALTPCIAKAQEVDRTRIVECVLATEGPDRFKPIDAHAAASKCVYFASTPCIEEAAKKWAYSAAEGVCYPQELEIWDRLLKQAFDAAVESLRQSAGERSAAHDDRLLPAFIAAHKAWTDFVKAECEVAKAVVDGGTTSKWADAYCALSLTAERVFTYRRQARQTDAGNAILTDGSRSP